MPGGFDEGALAFDVDVLLTQSCSVERDEASQDSFGGELKTERKVVATPRCRYSWWHVASGRGASREWADPQTTVFFTGGVLHLDFEADIQAGDHVGDITEAGVVIVPGPFQVESVQRWEEHTEAQLVRPAAE